MTTTPLDEAPSPDVVQVLLANHDRFLTFLERRVGSRADAEDILQDAFVRGLARTDQLRDEQSAVAWFYRLLRNAVIDHYRRQGSQTRALERVTAIAGDEEASSAEDEELYDTVCACVVSLLETLKPEYALALRRVEMEGTPVHAWAAEAGITPNNAAVRLFRARDALRKRVVQSCGTCLEHGCLDCTCKQHH